MKKLIALFIAAITITGGCVFALGEETVVSLPPVEFKAEKQIPENEINYLSEYTLIACPEKYDGKKIRVVGILKLDTNNSALFVNMEDYRFNITKNALWCNINPSLLKTKITDVRKLNGKYVVIEGVYNGLNSGHTDLYSGAVENISLIKELK